MGKQKKAEKRKACTEEDVDIETEQHERVKKKKHKKHKSQKNCDDDSQDVPADNNSTHNESVKTNTSEHSKESDNRACDIENADFNIIPNSGKKKRKSKNARADRNSGDNMDKEAEDGEDDSQGNKQDAGDSSHGNKQHHQGMTEKERKLMKEKKREKMRKKKEEKKEKKQQQQSGQPSQVAEKAALEYLRSWKGDRSAWKFQTVRQVWLLQHMYDNTKIGGQDFTDLLDYLEGLKGKAREQTIREAEELMRRLEEEAGDGDSPDDEPDSKQSLEANKKTDSGEGAEPRGGTEPKEKVGPEGGGTNEAVEAAPAANISSGRKQKNIDYERVRQIIQLLS